MTLLLIDDDEDTNLLIDLLLAKAEGVSDYHITGSAAEALDYLHGLDESPDCILVDLKMPEMDGFQFIEAYEQTLKEGYSNDACIYVLSSSTRNSDREKALNYESVKGFILKPLSKKKLADLTAELA